MKALTLWQPWASLVALGVKTIETRSWSTSFRGPLAIHAGKRQPQQALRVGDYLVGWEYKAPSHPVLFEHPVGEPWPSLPDNQGTDWARCTIHDLPLGAVVATGELVDVVPIVETGQRISVAWAPHVAEANGELWHWRGEDTYADTPRWDRVKVTDQRPYGDVAPGRFAWLLADVKPLDDPVPAKGKQGLWSWEP